MTTAQYTTVVGLEVHVQLQTSRKMFAPESARYGEAPNTQTSPISLAHPGTMPTLNKQAIDHAIMLGIACGSSITRYNWFDRKNYFYPDLPKGFQITQDKTPICREGIVVIDLPTGDSKEINLERIHLEEDTGKSIHAANKPLTLLNFDRAGCPLVEIVTKPDFRSAREASAFLTVIRQLVRYLGISNGNMEEGSLRCDANVSIMPVGSQKLGTKVELKNMNSIRHVRLAIAEEVKRQTELKERGEVIVSETRSYDAQTGKTTYQRTKEDLTDYRYFTEPDLSPFLVSDAWIADLKAQMPPLPRALASKFKTSYGLSDADATVLTDQKETGLFFEAVCQHTDHYKVAANWVIGPIKSHLNREKLSWQEFPLTPSTIAKLADAIADKVIGFSTAVQQIFPKLLANPTMDLEKLMHSSELQVDDTAQLYAWIDEALATYPEKVKAYHAGQKSLLGLFMGEVMKISHRKAPPQKTKELLEKKLDKLV